MILNYEKSFLKDIKKLKNKVITDKLKLILSQFEEGEDIADLTNIKKLKGHNTYYRLKINDYRLGFSYENGEIDIIRFLHRKDIYRLFP